MKKWEYLFDRGAESAAKIKNFPERPVMHAGRFYTSALRPEQIEIDILGFGYEKTSQKRPVFRSPRMEPLQANSSYTFIEPFKANVIIVAEVTTGIIDFHEQHLIQLEVVLFFLSLSLCTF